MTIEEIEVRNKRGQGSFQQREDIAFLLSKLRKAEEERDKVMESFATLGANMAHKLSKLEAESDRAKAVIEAAKKLLLIPGVGGSWWDELRSALASYESKTEGAS